METKRGWLSGAIAALAIGFGAPAFAGPVVIDGTDANDHGSGNATTNFNGWEYMQRVLENLGSQVAGSVSKTVVSLGTTPGTQARNAINSAFSLSTLAGTGWTLQHVDGAAAIGTYFSTLSTTTTGILYIPTFGLTSGDLATDEMAAVNAAAAAINTYVSGAGNPAQGGALWAMAESGTGEWGWLTTLIPGIVATDVGGGGIGTNITLTAAGATAFPGLTNADLAGADPWHTYFSGNLGGLSILGTAPDGNNTRNLILGGGAGTVIQCGQPGTPACPAPEPGSWALLGLAFATLAAFRRRRG